MEISGSTRLAAVIGSPVRHSLSPAMHNAAFAATGADWRMLALEVAPGSTADAVSAMRTLGIGGFAVTMPHKEAIADAVDDIDPAAKALRSVNTVVLRDDGSTFGASTDGPGFVDSLVDAGVSVESRRIVVLGAGGAARSIVDALGRAGAAGIVVVNRTVANAVAAAALSPVARVGTLDDLAEADLLVNSTSVGMGGGEMPVDAAWLRPDLAVADIVYHPLDTALLRAARATGATTVDGLGMLVHQAVRQQELWTGVRPEPAVLRTAAETELARRARHVAVAGASAPGADHSDR
jgi:shikimate dehydrogenase